MPMEQDYGRSADAEAEAAHKSLRRRVRKFKNLEPIFNRELRQVDNTILKLQQDREKLRSRRARLRDHWVPDAVRDYAIAWNRAFAQSLLSALPLELRTMIYDYILTEDYVERHYDDMLCVVQGVEFEPVEMIELPHVISEDCVGIEMAREVIQAFYGRDRNTQGFFSAYGPDNVEKLLFGDTMKLGIEPCKLLRVADIELYLDSMIAKETQLLNMPKFKATMNSLFAITKKSGFKLDLVLTQKRIRLNMLHEILPLLQKVKATFEAEGAVVNITWQYDSEENMKPLTWPLNDIVKATDTAWKRDLVVFLNENSDGTCRGHLEYLVEDLPGFDPVSHSETSGRIIKGRIKYGKIRQHHEHAGACFCTICLFGRPRSDIREEVRRLDVGESDEDAAEDEEDEDSSSIGEDHD